MKNKFKLFCLLFFIASCKYEDGPLFSLVSVPNRIAGDYTVDYVTENGVNQMDRIDTLHINYFSFSTGPSLHGNDYGFQVRIADSITYYSDWFLSGDEKELITGTFGCGGYNPPDTVPSFQPLPGFKGTCVNEATTWTITKLSQKKIWLKTQYNNNNYEVHLKQFKSVQ